MRYKTLTCRHSGVVDGGIGNAGDLKGFATLAAGAAGAAMVLAAAIATVCMAVVHAYGSAALGYLPLGEVRVRRQQGNAVVGAGGYGARHILDKGGAAIGIYGVVAAVVGQHHVRQVVRLGKAGCDGKHNAVAEGHDGAAHVFVIVIAVGDGIGPGEQRTCKMLADKFQGYDHQRNIELGALEASTFNFARVVIAAVVKGHGHGDARGVLAQHGDGVHAAAHHHQSVFLHILQYRLRNLHIVAEGGHQSLPGHFLVVFVAVIGKWNDGYAAARCKQPGDLDVLGVHQAAQVLHNDIDAIFVKITVVAERKQVELQALALDHLGTRDIRDDDFAEIGLSRLGAQRRKFGAGEGHEIFVVGMLIVKSFKHLGTVVGGIFDAGVSQQGHSRHFLRCTAHSVYFSVNSVFFD